MNPKEAEAKYCPFIPDAGMHQTNYEYRENTFGTITCSPRECMAWHWHNHTYTCNACGEHVVALIKPITCMECSTNDFKISAGTQGFCALIPGATA